MTVSSDGYGYGNDNADRYGDGCGNGAYRGYGKSVECGYIGSGPGDGYGYGVGNSEMGCERGNGVSYGYAGYGHGDHYGSGYGDGRRE